MFDRYDFLERLLKKAGTRQRVLDVIGLPSSRSPELFNRGHRKPRGLSVEEAIRLSRAFDVPLEGDALSAEKLFPVLRVCLQHAPTSWGESDVQRLAYEIELGLRFQRSFAYDLSPPDQRRTQEGDRFGKVTGDG